MKDLLDGREIFKKKHFESFADYSSGGYVGELLEKFEEKGFNIQGMMYWLVEHYQETFDLWVENTTQWVDFVKKYEEYMQGEMSKPEKVYSEYSFLTIALIRFEELESTEEDLKLILKYVDKYLKNEDSIAGCFCSLIYILHSQKLKKIQNTQDFKNLIIEYLESHKILEIYTGLFWENLKRAYRTLRFKKKDKNFKSVQELEKLKNLGKIENSEDLSKLFKDSLLASFTNLYFMADTLNLAKVYPIGFKKRTMIHSLSKVFKHELESTEVDAIDLLEYFDCFHHDDTYHLSKDLDFPSIDCVSIKIRNEEEFKDRITQLSKGSVMFYFDVLINAYKNEEYRDFLEDVVKFMLTTESFSNVKIYLFDEIYEYVSSDLKISISQFMKSINKEVTYSWGRIPFCDLKIRDAYYSLMNKLYLNNYFTFDDAEFLKDSIYCQIFGLNNPSAETEKSRFLYRLFIEGLFENYNHEAAKYAVMPILRNLATDKNIADVLILKYKEIQSLAFNCNKYDIFLLAIYNNPEFREKIGITELDYSEILSYIYERENLESFKSIDFINEIIKQIASNNQNLIDISILKKIEDSIDTCVFEFIVQDLFEELNLQESKEMVRSHILDCLIQRTKTAGKFDESVVRLLKLQKIGVLRKQEVLIFFDKTL